MSEPIAVEDLGSWEELTRQPVLDAMEARKAMLRLIAEVRLLQKEEIMFSAGQTFVMMKAARESAIYEAARLVEERAAAYEDLSVGNEVRGAADAIRDVLLRRS